MDNTTCYIIATTVSVHMCVCVCVMDINIVLVLCLCASPLLAHDHDGCLDEKEGPTFAATIFATNSSVTSDDISQSF